MTNGFFALLDDIAMLMDDVAAMTKVAGKKTAVILGDDLAVNAEKATGFTPSRELPVIWKITKGSFLNKLIILPVAFALSAFVPSAIEALLLVGGVYLAYEGMEKMVHYLSPSKHAEGQINSRPSEAKRIRSAVIIDFILSVEIVVIALGQVMEADLGVQIAAVSAVALLATVGVYGLVAMLVRMDDVGLRLLQRESNLAKRTGNVLISLLPKVVKVLGVIGTVALVLVSGGIFHHHIHAIHELLHSWPGILADIVCGLVGGILAFVLIHPIRLFAMRRTPSKNED